MTIESKPEISIGEAAGILGVSRPYLIGLLDAGRLPYRKSSKKPNARRYMKTDDVLDYKRRRAKAQAMMDQYGAISDALGV
jgi:excisionase family DNA binding protein